MDPSTTVHRLYGRWRHQLALSTPNHLLPVTAHVYEAPTPFPSFLRPGDQVQLIAISPTVYRTLFMPPGQNMYDVYDPQVVGRVEGMRAVGPDRLVILVENARSEHGVPWAVISAPFVPGKVPVALSEECRVEWAKELLEMDWGFVRWGANEVVVADNLVEGVTPPVNYRFPDPKMRRRDRKITDKGGAWKPYAQ
ncbi:hypothetical protein C8T65DRAFT_735283 [Cerioporus squamosus]|nr:hypothetical protein C8T65DRAFT_735283 [Cerioporus squamosus]